MNDSLEALLTDLRAWSGFWPERSHVIRRLAALVEDHDRPATSEREVISSEEARDLPEGSLLVGVTYDKRPSVGASVIKVKGPGESYLYQDYMVLYRAPETPVKVGDTITGRRANAMPDGTVVQRASAASYYPLTKVRGRYCNGAYDSRPDVLMDDWTFTVLVVGTGSLSEEN